MLGISIGTRNIGIAVIRKGHLVDWQVKSFKGKMDEQKLHMISGAILKLIREYDCKVAVLKLPDKTTSYANIVLLKKHLTKTLTSRKITIHYYSLCDIKARLPGSICNKQKLAQWSVSHYKELRFVYGKEQKNKNQYYIKLFEAVAVLHIHIHSR